MKKITYFLSHPIQYFSPLLKELAKKTDLQVYYFSDVSITGKKDVGFGQNVKWDIPLLEGYTAAFVKNYSCRTSLRNRFFDVFNPGVIKLLLKKESSVIIVNGWTYSSTLLCLFFGRLFGKEVWLRAENPLNQELRKRKIIITVKKIIFKYLLFNIIVDKCLYIGKENRKFFEFYGVPSSKLIYTPYAVDNDFFSQQFISLQKDLGSSKIKLGLPIEKKTILFSGKYISKKRPLDLIKAFHQLNDANCSLVMVGEGEMRTQMETYIKENDLKDVYLTGFINQSDISKYYAVADVFVMCSGMGETWGLSVNEAMNFKKPVIVSETCGSSYDLVEHGKNGFVYKEGDIELLAKYLQQLLSNEEFRVRAGERSYEIIQDFSIPVIIENIVLATNSFV
jgi:glycosyltransferase involved in cell wall biosynthesis